MKKILLSLLFVVSAFVSFGQAICGSEERMKHLIETDTVSARKLRLNELKIQEYIRTHGQSRPGSTTAVVNIPVVIHVMHTGGAVGTIYNPSDANILGALTYLNQVYAGTYAGTEIPSGAAAITNMEINFVLASRTPSCGATNGIDRVNASSLSGYTSNGINNSGSSGTPELNLKDLSRWDPANYYNIWVVNKIDGLDGTSGQFVAGYAYYPGTASTLDGTVMLATQMVAGASTLPHEIGHAFNLSHTFQGSNLNTVCQPNANCATDGDGICDTGPVSNNVNGSGIYDFTCRTGVNTPCGGSYTINTEHNYMAYTSCHTLFTAGQKTRTQAALTLPSRAGFATSYAFTPCSKVINFSQSSDSKAESTTGTTIDCRKYTDYTYQMTIGAAPLASVIATLSYSGTATKGVDYDVTTNGSFVAPSNALTFAGAATTAQSFTVRVFDDAADELVETAILNFTLNNGNATVGTTFPTFTLTITDNDVPPSTATPISGAIGTASTNIGAPFYASAFDSRSQMLYTASELQALGFTAGNITSIGFTIGSKNSTQAYNNFSIKLKNTNTTALSGTFETGTVAAYGPVAYTIPATGLQTITLTTPYLWDGTSNLIVDICFDNATASAGNDNINAAPSSGSTYIAIANTNAVSGCSIASTGSVYTGFRPVFTFGITPIATTISTVLNSTKNAYLGPNDDVYFYDASGNILARIKNLTTFDYGCTQVTIDRAGTTSAQFWNATTANYLASKSIKVVPTNNTAAGNYQISLYYSSGEVTGWQSATGQLWANTKMVKVSNGFYVPDVSAASPHTSDVSVITPSPVPTTYGANYIVTGTFSSTGFSGFAVGVPGTGGCPTITVTNPGVSTGTANTVFSQTFTQTGAVGGATFSLNSGTLPTGLTLSAAGILSGTPTQTGTFPLTIKVTDGNTCIGTGTTYNLVISCQTITVTNPVTASGTTGTAFSQTFTKTGSIGSTTFTINTGTLPTGLTLSTAGVLSGTPTQGGTFPITVKVSDGNGCVGTGTTYNLVINCPAISVTNPLTATGIANSVFSQTFTQTGATGGATFSINSGTLPTGLTLSTAGVLSGTPTQTGSFPITVKVTSGHGCIGTGSTYTIVISCQTITVTNPATLTGTTGTAFSQTFTKTGSIGSTTFTLNTGTLPTGLTLSTAGVLSGTPTQGGTFPITVKVTDGNGCVGTGTTYNLVINCPTISVTNPLTATGIANSVFSQTFTQTGATGGATFSINTGTLPTGLTLSTAGVLSGTPTQTGSFPITVKVTSGHGCIGTGSTYTIVISCQTITVTNPATATGTTGTAFSQTFTQTGAIGSITFALNSGTLPTGLTLSTAGVLSGTPTQGGTFPITVKVTDGNGCMGTGTTYSLVINCTGITVTNPATTTGIANTAFNQTFTQTGAGGGATFSLNSGTLPTGLILSVAGVLSGTPTQTGSFPLTIKVTASNGCIGTGSTYNLVISCQTITVTNPATVTGTTGTAFSQTFTRTNSIGSITFALNSGILPSGVTLSAAGVLSGTPTQSGSFPVTVKVTDANGCVGTGVSYNLVISCPAISVLNPGTATGTANAVFSQTFTQTGATGGAIFSINTGTLPSGLSLSAAGVLSGTPTQTGSFPLTVKVTSGHGCIGNGVAYNLVIGCQSISVTNPATNTGIAGIVFNQPFNQTGGIGSSVFSVNTGVLPTGFTLSSAGVLSGTTTQTGSFPITVKITDGNGCIGISTTYSLLINCQTIIVTNPLTTTGTSNTAFSQTFTQTGAVGGSVFTVNTGTLPTGFTLSSGGLLSGTTNQTGTFPLTIKVTGGNGCVGNGSTYNLIIGCGGVTVTNPVITSGTSGTAFSQTFTQTGAVLPVVFSLNSGTLPAGLTLSSAGVLSGTATQTGSFSITVKATGSNGCAGIGSTYTLVMGCQTITITNPATTTGTAAVAFSQTFNQTGAVGGATFSLNSGTLPTGLTLSSAGVLSGIPSQTGSFPITVKVNGGNACIGTGSTYTLVIGSGSNITLNLKAFLQGFYIGSNSMQANLYNLDLSVDPTATDNISVNLWSAASLGNDNPDYTITTLLHTDGTAAMQFPAAVNGNLFYIAVKHRNSIETWSKFPVSFTASTSYDFSTGLIKAYDDGINAAMANMGGAVYAIYGGDVNQDGTVDASDMAIIDNDKSGFAYGYNDSDANGDGATDASDISIVDNNQALFLYYARPY